MSCSVKDADTCELPVLLLNEQADFSVLEEPGMNGYQEMSAAGTPEALQPFPAGTAPAGEAAPTNGRASATAKAAASRRVLGLCMK
jgi:hypothetical protein